MGIHGQLSGSDTVLTHSPYIHNSYASTTECTIKLWHFVRELPRILPRKPVFLWTLIFKGTTHRFLRWDEQMFYPQLMQGETGQQDRSSQKNSNRGWGLKLNFKRSWGVNACLYLKRRAGISGFKNLRIVRKANLFKSPMNTMAFVTSSQRHSTTTCISVTVHWKLHSPVFQFRLNEWS